MKKITLKLDKIELQGIMHLLELTIQNPEAYGYSKDDCDRLLLSALTELYYKLHTALDLFKSNYKVKITITQAMAFMAHFKAQPDTCIPQQMLLPINTAIGIIDQQTV